MTEPELRVLSLGAGTQSTALLLMAAHGEVGPPLDAVIFADTGWEPAAVYRHLWWLAEKCAEADLPLIVVGGSSLRHDALDGQRRKASLPVKVRNPGGGKGQLRRLVDLRTPADRGQGELFEDGAVECGGHCFT